MFRVSRMLLLVWHTNSILLVRCAIHRRSPRSVATLEKGRSYQRSLINTRIDGVCNFIGYENVLIDDFAH